MSLRVESYTLAAHRWVSSYPSRATTAQSAEVRLSIAGRPCPCTSSTHTSTSPTDSVPGSSTRVAAEALAPGRCADGSSTGVTSTWTAHRLPVPSHLLPRSRSVLAPPVAATSAVPMSSSRRGTAASPAPAGSSSKTWTTPGRGCCAPWLSGSSLSRPGLPTLLHSSAGSETPSSVTTTNGSGSGLRSNEPSVAGSPVAPRTHTSTVPACSALASDAAARASTLGLLAIGSFGPGARYFQIWDLAGARRGVGSRD
eukprot:scaffold17497_cov96-Isochrysis_galbana.AAC.4